MENYSIDIGDRGIEMKLEEARLKIENKLKKTVDADPRIHNAYLLIHSDKHNIHWNMAYGESSNAEQPYHTASIAKTFTSKIIAKLVEEEKINYNDPISKYLSEDIMKDLHIYKGTDFSKDIRIEHLVSNSSGLPDFYEEKPSQDKPFLDKLLDDPSRFWTPQETIQWTKQNMQPRFHPGKKCHLHQYRIQPFRINY
jgi:CubicO group peptidase (beta-lactamase class C family)